MIEKSVAILAFLVIPTAKYPPITVYEIKILQQIQLGVTNNHPAL